MFSTEKEKNIFSLRRRFDHRPCQTMDVSLLIYEWFNDVPLFPWTKSPFYAKNFVNFSNLSFLLDAGVHIGVRTPYRYVVLHVEFLSSDVTSVIAQRLLLTDQK